ASVHSLDQVEQVEFGFRHTAPDGRALDQRHLTADELVAEPLADDAPAQGAEDFPEAHPPAVHRLARRRLVGLEQFLAPAEATHGLVDPTKAPGVEAHPAEVLERIAEMCRLPVEHGEQAIRIDDEIAVAEIPV